MKAIKLSAIVVMAIMMSACGSTSSMFTYTSRSNAIDNVNISATQTIVDVRPDFGRRINAESSPCVTADEAKAEAKYNAIMNQKIDIVVDPIYKIEYKNGRYTAYLTGYAGYYENPRTLLGDIQLLDSVSKESIKKYLMLKGDPQILKYLGGPCHEDGVNIFHCGGKPGCHPEMPEAAPGPKPAKGKK